MTFLRTLPAHALRLSLTLCVCGLVAASGAIVAHAQTTTDQLFIAHYTGNSATASTLRYDYSQTGSTAPVFTENEGTSGNTTPYLTGSGVSVSEGTATSQNQLFGVGGSNNNVVYVYDRATKAYRGSIGGFGSIGNIALSNDGKYLYVADENNGSLEAVDLSAIGSSRSSVLITDAGVRAGRDTTNKWHDILVDASGNVYGAAYSATAAADRNIFKFTSPTLNLASKTQFNTTAIGTGGITGMTIVGSSFYAVNNKGQGTTAATNGSIFKYDLSGNIDSTFNVTSASLTFGFGLQRGPDGNLYVASLNGYTSGTDTSNISQVIINPSKTYGTAIGTVKEVISSDLPNKPIAVANNEVDPKYFVFGDTNAIPVPTNFGTTVVPEPGTLVLSLCGILGVVTVARRRRAR